MKTYTIPGHTVTEVEKEDWDWLNHMTVTEAVDFLDKCGDLENWIGSYSYGSTDPDEYNKAKMLRAYSKIVYFARQCVYGKKGDIE